MIARLISWCLRNPFLIGVGVIGIFLGGYYAATRTPVDAIPDIGEKQVIVYADWQGRSPQDVDNQVTFPLTTSLAGTPGVKSIRSMSGFGFSMVFVIFKDEVDYYWARSRVIERMNVAQQRLPSGVVPVIGPDATALGQIFWYTVEGKGFDLVELRSIQDWYLRYQLTAVEGVSEVASIGGFVKQYQIDLDPNKLRAHRVSLMDVYTAVQKANIDVGAKVIEQNGIEYFIRGIGFIRSTEDLEKVVIRQEAGAPIQVKTVGSVKLGPEFRRGSLDKSGREAVGGVVLMRYGENPLAVVERVKEALKKIEPGLPQKTLADGSISKVQIVPFYDRTDIVNQTIATLREALTEEAIMASVVILVFLLHLRSTVSVLVTLPLSLAMCFILMFVLGVDANIMSLAGLAIAIGDVADMGIIMTENIYRKIASALPGKSHFEKVFEGASEVARPILTAVSNTVVSFIPVFFLTDQEGKMFSPLAYTKTFAIGSSAVLAVVVVPVVCYFLFRPLNLNKKTRYFLAGSVGLAATVVMKLVFDLGWLGRDFNGWPASLVAGVIVALAFLRATQEKFLPLEENPVSRKIARVYSPSLRWVLNHKKMFLLAPLLILFSGMAIWLGIGKILYPIEWAVNKFSYEISSSAPSNDLSSPNKNSQKRPIIELDQLRWEKLSKAGNSRYRLLIRRQTPAEKEQEQQAGVSVVKSTRILPGIGREFMPPLDEGSFLYMPSILPHGGLGPAIEVNARQNMAIASVPEVQSVVGKLGRAESALDPAPISMMETIVVLKPEDQWRHVPVTRWFSDWPGWFKKPLTWIAPEHRQITKAEILQELQEKTAIPGVLPTWLQPIQTRLVMLQTGFRAMMGVKIYGGDLKEIEKIGLQIEGLLKEVPGATDIVADRIVGKPYLEFEINRDEIARYGVNIRDIQDVVEVAIGGINLMESVEGRERYPIRVRYARDFREDIPSLENILVDSSSGAKIPISKVAKIKMVLGPQEIKGERGLLVGYVTMNTRDRDEVSVVEDAEQLLRTAIKDGRLSIPSGYYWEWSGQFENQVRAVKRMTVLVPICLAIMFLMLYLGFKRWWIAPVIFFGVVVSAAGGFILLGIWGANLSVAVWVGFLVLFGVVDDDGVIMATYLEGIFDERRFESISQIREAVVEAGLKRIRPCLMTLSTTVFGLMPVFWSTGRGADVMQPMAIPSIGGMAVSVVTLFIVPCLFCAVEEWKWKRARQLPNKIP